MSDRCGRCDSLVVRTLIGIAHPYWYCTWFILTIYKPDARAVPWNTKLEVLKYGPSLRGPCVKNEGLVFHGTARAIRLINSLLNGKNENIPNIDRQFADNSPKIFFTKLVQNHFSNVFCWFSNFPKISWKLTENSTKKVAHEFIKNFFPSFITFRSFPRIWDNFVKHALSILLGNWIHRAGWRYPARWSANQIARKQGRMSSHYNKGCNYTLHEIVLVLPYKQRAIIL